MLIDPPFEEPDEGARIEAALAGALTKWPRGTYALWRPIKASLDDARFLNGIAALGAPNILRLELDVGAVAPQRQLPPNPLVARGSSSSIRPSNSSRKRASSCRGWRRR